MKEILRPQIEAITTPKRLTKTISIVASTGSLILAAACYWLLEIRYYVPLVFVVYSILNLGVYLLFRINDDLKLVYKLTAFLIFAGSFLVSMFSGGINSAFVFFIPVVVISGYSMKRKYGDVWLIICMSIFFTLYFMDDQFISEMNCVPKKSESTFSILSLFLSTTVLGGIYGRYLSTAIYKSIKKTVEVTEEKAEKDVLLKEVQHRVKDNLRTVSDMLNLQENLVDDPQVKGQFRFSKFRVQAMVMIHEMLYKSDSITKINFNDYVTKLTKYLMKAFGKDKNGIKIQIEAKDIAFNMDTAVPLGLLANEVLTNTFMHSLREGHGTISIKLEQLNYPSYILEIGDDGKGFSEQLKFNSIGQELIDNLALQLQGTVEKDESKKGANFVIIFQEVQAKEA